MGHAIHRVQWQVNHQGGVQVQESVSVVAPNGLPLLVTFLGCVAARAKVSPLNPAYGVEEFTFYLQDTESKALIIPSSWASHAAREAAASLNIPVWEINEEDPKSVRLDIPQAPSTIPEELPALAQPVPEDVALFLHTSGTTSKPKGVPLTHLNLTTSMKNIAGTYLLTPDDITLIVMPLFHVHGLIGATLSTFYSHGRVVVPPRFSATQFWEQITSHGVTWYSAVPTIHQILLHCSDTTPIPEGISLRFIRSSSSSLAPSVLEKVEERFGAPVLEAYGMTEASHQMASNPLPQHGERRPGTVGKGMNVDIEIQDDEGQALPEGEKGEVCIRGKNVTLGYHNRPDANKENFRKGWFRTGDQGFLSEGYLTLTGRLKELINRGGEKISPIELDSVLLEHPDIKSAVSFAVPDTKYGEEVHAAVVLKEDRQTTEQDIQDFCRSKMADFKIPKVVYIADDFPRTATGKIQRRIVSAHFFQSSE